MGIDAGEFFEPANAGDQVAGLGLREHTLQFGFGALGLFPPALSIILSALGVGFGVAGFLLVSVSPFVLLAHSVIAQKRQDHHYKS